MEIQLIMKVLLPFLFSLLVFSGYSNVNILVNNRHVAYTKTIFLKQGDTLCLTDQDTLGKKCWYEIDPEQLNYDISNSSKPYHSLISYKIAKLSSEKSLTIMKVTAGTIYFGLFDDNDSLVKNGELNEKRPLQSCYDNIFQIVVRENDSYRGYLTELINTPFILPPTFINGFGHQTDLRIGSDCAELAIYGKRRMGYNIPYVGPSGIVNFLDEIKKDSLFEGCILHFGFQVSVLYKDNGKKGKLDADDILIQSLEGKACLTEFRYCSYYNYPYKAFKWKE